MCLQRSIIALCFCLAILCPSAHTQEVWPGDINNNGVVNGVDLLYWGIAFGSSGPARPEVSTDWQGIPLAAPWGQSFPDGINYAYADCDGSGLVDEDDFDKAIDDNYGLTHGPLLPEGYANGQAGQAPRLRLTADATQVNFGATVNISLSFDPAAQLPEDFYGLAARFSYNRDALAGDDGVDFDFQEDNWIEADNSFVEELFVDDRDLERAELAVTRTNQQNILAEPTEIGSFSIVIEDIIVGRSVDTFTLRIDSILVINNERRIIPIAPDTVQIIITDGSTVTSSPRINNSNAIRVYPNPSSGDLYVESKETLLHLEAQILDQLGRAYPLRTQALRTGTYLLKRPDLPPGIYWLAVRTEDGWSGKKIILL